MREYRYYVSSDPATPSPPTGELLAIVSDSVSDAVELIKSNDFLKHDPQSQWLHVLVWTSDDDQQRGFESHRLR
jgi:hypothetical protein